MSPFSVALRQLRAEYDVAQGELADRLGLRQAYISQLERGAKLPKDKDLVRKIVQALRLHPEEEASLWRAFQASRKFDFPPSDAPAAAYRYFAKLSDALPRLSSADFNTLSTFLDSVGDDNDPNKIGTSNPTPESQAEVPM
ncbi:helix-turn-helix transcriptional regulator [Burkholderia lata]|uniref:XRE family transcriptional regulator n=1 Tax=Burkholderia lata (strain ATCC 17760 / DSM 23089 / LMG 22485 / NCIMB 9086 / R18194 / 383) TaxID=482957 RepID=A0A6P2S837_BURL3|nr:helix-turn-helix transcriptional regulator [Burkholderia lata]VWC41878.1 XRE family transcriptional regulator [Burkholderia lata]